MYIPALFCLALTAALAHPTPSSFCYPDQITMEADIVGAFAGHNTQYLDFSLNIGGNEYADGTRFMLNYAHGTAYEIKPNGTCRSGPAHQYVMVSQCLPPGTEYIGEESVGDLGGHQFLMMNTGDRVVKETWGTVAGKNVILHMKVTKPTDPASNYITTFSNWMTGVDADKLVTPTDCTTF